MTSIFPKKITIKQESTLFQPSLLNSISKPIDIDKSYSQILKPELDFLRTLFSLNYLSASFLIDTEHPNKYLAISGNLGKNSSEYRSIVADFDEFGKAAEIIIDKKKFSYLTDDQIIYITTAIIRRFQTYRLFSSDFYLSHLGIDKDFLSQFCDLMTKSFSSVGTILWKLRKRDNEIQSEIIDGFDPDVGDEYRLPCNNGIIGSNYKSDGIVVVNEFKDAIHKNFITDYKIREIVIKTVIAPSGDRYIVSCYLRRSYNFTPLDRYLFSTFTNRLDDFLQFKSSLDYSNQLIEKTKEHAVIINHGLMGVLQVHDLRDSITDINSYSDLIMQYSRRGGNSEAEKLIIDTFFESIDVLGSISKQLSKNASITKPKKRSISLIDLMLEISELRKKELLHRDRPIEIELRLVRFNELSTNYRLTRKLVDEKNHQDRVKRNILSSVVKEKIHADQWQLRRYFGNLIDNAIYWTDNRSKTERTKGKKIILISIEIDHKDLVIGVHDQGFGVSQEIKGCMYDVYNSKKPGGMGFGLFVCETIAKVNDYTIKYEKNNNGGASFKTIIKT